MLTSDDHNQLQQHLNVPEFKSLESLHRSSSQNVAGKSSDSEDDKDEPRQQPSSSIDKEENSNDFKDNIKYEEPESKRRKSEEDHTNGSFSKLDMKKSENNLPRRKNALRAQLAQQIIQSSTKQLKKPLFPVRPATSGTSNNSTGNGNLALDSTVLLSVFRYLQHDTLVNCTLVCKTWADIACNPKLWKRMNCTEHKLSASLLIAIVRRQPEHLILDWTILAKRQLQWIIGKFNYYLETSIY